MKNIYLLIVWFFLASFARADMGAVASLEWLADSSTSIGIYELASYEMHEDFSCTLSLRLKQALKADPPATTQTGYAWHTRNNLPGTTVALGDRFLICIGAEHGPISLTAPQPYEASFAAVTARGEVLTDSTKVLRVIKSRLRAHPNKTPASRDQRVFVPDPSGQRYSYPHSFYSCSVTDSFDLIVPKDLKPKWMLPERKHLIQNTEEEEEVVQPLGPTALPQNPTPSPIPATDPGSRQSN